MLNDLRRVDSPTTTLWIGVFPVAVYLVSFNYDDICFIDIPVFNAYSVDPNQMPHSAASDLDLHCLPITLGGYEIYHKTPFTLRKHAYSNTLKILPPKMAIFQIKNSDIFHISAQNIDCGYLLEPSRRGGSNEYPQSMFLSRNKKNNVYPL